MTCHECSESADTAAGAASEAMAELRATLAADRAEQLAGPLTELVELLRAPTPSYSVPSDRVTISSRPLIQPDFTAMAAGIGGPRVRIPANLDRLSVTLRPTFVASYAIAFVMVGNPGFTGRDDSVQLVITNPTVYKGDPATTTGAIISAPVGTELTLPTRAELEVCLSTVLDEDGQPATPGVAAIRLGVVEHSLDPQRGR